ncbi:hypothetical protein SAMN04487843_105122 [Methylobacterium sp. ap11]|uniref:hypothetical protein n=1 Tax=Methylobacterium sp. ap11 TaxID=1761799 RepID=UPI0008C5AE61|nr:hypothetical protein [Methylobacterium sp. ap11]SEO94310.1 hypothetical protein SAMN04487843_105122 [Methylobacterium sp. ap11]
MPPVRDDLAAVAARIQAMWETGRICSLVGRGMRARVLRAARLVEAGRLTLDEARQVAREAEGVATSFAPLPEPPHD